MGDDSGSWAFVALYRRYLDPIYKYCYRRRLTAEDATRLVFTIALAKVPRQREEGHLYSWQLAMAHNAWCEYV